MGTNAQHHNVHRERESETATAREGPERGAAGDDLDLTVGLTPITTLTLTLTLTLIGLNFAVSEL